MKKLVTVIAITAALALAGCSSAAPVDAPAPSVAAAPAEGVDAAPVESDAAEAQAPADGQTMNDRGNLTAALGQEISPFDPGTASVVGTFTITGIAPSECVTDSAPENGKFLTVAMEAQGAPAADNPDSLPFYANSGGGVLTIIKADGTTWGGVPTTAECLPSEDRMPAAVDVGEKYSGNMVLDVPEDAAMLVFKPTLGLGYEFALS